MTNLRKAIFHLQQSIRFEHPNNDYLLKALNLMGDVEMGREFNVDELNKTLTCTICVRKDCICI